MNDFDEVPSQMELLQHLMASIEEEKGTATLTVKVQGFDAVEFAVIGTTKSLRYAAALLATGNRQLAATVVTEH